MGTAYRGYAVRRESRAKRDYSGPDGSKEAAKVIQYFWKKWKTKSMFQQLMLYRADKQQQLVYFCQQVNGTFPTPRY